MSPLTDEGPAATGPTPELVSSRLSLADRLAADEAERDVVAYEIVRLGFDHRESCPTCLSGGECRRWLDGTRMAVDAIADWMHARSLRTRAEHLREVVGP